MLLNGENRCAILVDLDCILDTRFACLKMLNEELAMELVGNEDRRYYLRRSDIWSALIDGFDQDKYNELWENRDVEVLRNATMSNFVPYLLEIVQSLEMDLISGGGDMKGVDLVINTYPYILSDKDEFFLIQSLMYYFGAIVKVMLDRIEPEKANVRYLSYQGYTQYAMYEFNKWMHIHYVEGKESVTSLDQLIRYPDFTIIAPKLLSVEPDEKLLQELAEENLQDEDPFNLMMGMCASLFHLIHIEIGLYGVLDLTAQESAE